MKATATETSTLTSIPTKAPQTTKTIKQTNNTIKHIIIIRNKHQQQHQQKQQNKHQQQKQKQEYNQQQQRQHQQQYKKH